MEESDHWTAEDLNLTKSDLYHYPESLSEILYLESWPGKFKITYEPADGIKKCSKGYQKGYCKDYLLGHSGLVQLK
jgi:hypothetical protein